MSGRVGRAEFEALIPHKGGMCLIETVEAWDRETIRASTRTHRDPANPLRRAGRLAGVHLVEYGAQGMAVHCGLVDRLLGRPTGRPGVLVAARDVALHAARFDDVEAPLTVLARRLVANASGWLYSFEVEAAGRRLASGRVSVMPPQGSAA